jgi:hypothetical protein
MRALLGEVEVVVGGGVVEVVLVVGGDAAAVVRKEAVAVVVGLALVGPEVQEEVLQCSACWVWPC